MTIERKPIRRGGIRSAGYDTSARVLEGEFDDGSVLQYISSAAPASYYKDNIEEEFPSRRIR